MKLTRLIALLSYYTGVDAVFYRLNRKAKRVVTFHNVLPNELWRAELANGVSHRLRDFRAIVDEISRRFSFSTDLFDAETVTITFDDGYHNQYEYAFKTLREKGIPAYLFVSRDISGEGGSSTSLVIDQLLHWVSCVPIELIPGGNRLQYWVKEIWPAYVADNVGRGRIVLAQLESKYPYEKIRKGLSDDYKRERLTGISDAELDEMRAAGWKIGGHTKSHYPLSNLSESELRAELDGPADQRGVCFSYPYGNSVEVGDAAVRMVEELGYPCAVSNTNSAVLNKTSKYFLPRMSLESANKYEINFVLSGAKYFLKHGRLLPR